MCAIHLGHVCLLHLLLIEFDLVVVLLPHVSKRLSQFKLVLHLTA